MRPRHSGLCAQHGCMDMAASESKKRAAHLTFSCFPFGCAALICNGAETFKEMEQLLSTSRLAVAQQQSQNSALVEQLAGWLLRRNVAL